MKKYKKVLKIMNKKQDVLKNKQNEKDIIRKFKFNK